jgi:hypothetical protein
VANFPVWARGNHIQGVVNSTILKLFAGPKSLARVMSPRILNGSEESNDVAYTFSVNSPGKTKSKPLFEIVIHGTPLTIMVDSGASVNVLDEKDYQALTQPPPLQ